MRLAFLVALPALASAQLVPVGAIPKGPNPPVVFLNGYQSDCTSSSFAGTFGNADKVLQASNIASVFFENCTVPNHPKLEILGSAFGQFLAGLRFTDGSAVTQVDIVAHSMGGLIVRSYLAGKQDAAPAAYNPPANPGIRKAVFLSTPHFGTALANQLGTDAQTAEMSLGSQFLFDLNTWNEGLEDLRGVDSVAVIGSGGTGVESTGGAGFDDGVVALTSSSLGFVRASRTRVVPTCHANISLLFTFGLCAQGTQPIAIIADSNNVVGQIIISFLTGTDAWQSLGQAIEANALGATKAGINLQVQDSNGTPQGITTATGLQLATSGQVAYNEALAPNVDLSIQIQTAGGPVTATPKLTAGTALPIIVKPGPIIHGAVPGNGAVFPYAVAPGAYVAIYGAGFAATTPSDVQVQVNGASVPVGFASAGQLNIIWPDLDPGLSKLTVTTRNGQFTTNVIVQAAVPSVFNLGGTTAAAENAITGAIVTADAPLRAGQDIVALFLTGLGKTTPKAGLDYAVIQPTVTVGGQDCPVAYAGRVPGVPALDQINCPIPAGISGAAVPVIVTSNGRASTAVTLNIR
jgi:uncharacterized protein (TIGR03437 family)